jgi:hypothetical protein
MNNKEIIEVLKKDIIKLKKEGYKDISLIKGLSLFGKFEACLMVGIIEGEGLGNCFKKTYRIIEFKSDFSRNEFLRISLEELKGVLKE